MRLHARGESRAVRSFSITSSYRGNVWLSDRLRRFGLVRIRNPAGDISARAPRGDTAAYKTYYTPISYDGYLCYTGVLYAILLRCDIIVHYTSAARKRSGGTTVADSAAIWENGESASSPGVVRGQSERKERRRRRRHSIRRRRRRRRRGGNALPLRRRPRDSSFPAWRPTRDARTHGRPGHL